MNARQLASLSLALALAACEQESQTLPFSSDGEDITVRTISGSENAVVTSSAGVAVRFPAGALSQSTEISIAPVAPPAGIAGSGSPVSRGFRVAPGGLVLAHPALVELRISSDIESSRAWLASLVVVTADGVEEVGNTRLDLRARLAEAPISRLGTLVMVIPEARAVFITRSGQFHASLAPGASQLLASGTDSVSVGCGAQNSRCDGLFVHASANLEDKVDQAAAVFPRVSGTLRFSGGRASGKIELHSSVRLLLRSGATSENVELRGVLQPTEATRVSEDASSITLSNVSVRVSGSAGSDDSMSETTRTIVIEKGVDGGYASFSRTFQLRDESEQLSDASVAITFPVRIHQ